MRIRPVALGLALIALAGLAATTALASGSVIGRATATQKCFDFTVVQPDPQAQFKAGVYHRQNFSPNNSLSCNTTFDVFRSYLYDPTTLRGWTAGKLTGPLRNATGKRFVKNGTNGSSGFNIYRNQAPPKPGTIVKTITMQANTTKTYSYTIPTRTADVAENTSLVGTGGSVMQQSGYTVQGAETIYFAQVQTFANPGQVRFTISYQKSTPAG